MNFRRVLQHHHVLALEPGKAQLGDCLAAVFDEALFVGGISPGSRHHLGAVARADALLEEVDDLVDRAGVDEALLDEERFQRLDAQRRLLRVVRCGSARPSQVILSSEGGLREC